MKFQIAIRGHNGESLFYSVDVEKIVREFQCIKQYEKNNEVH